MTENSLQEKIGFNIFLDNPPDEVGTYTAVLDNGIMHDMKYIPGKVTYPGKWELNGMNFTSRIICWRKVFDEEDISKECISTSENDSEA